MKKIGLLLLLLIAMLPVRAQYYGSLQKLDKAKGIGPVKLGMAKHQIKGLYPTFKKQDFDWYLKENENLTVEAVRIKHVFYGFTNNRLAVIQIIFDQKHHHDLYLALRGLFGWPDEVEVNYRTFQIWRGKKVVLVMDREKLQFFTIKTWLKNENQFLPLK